MDKIAVLIPCYNEALTVQKVVKDAKAYLPEATVYVYDDNSTDGTGRLAEEAGAIVIKEPRQGKGNVVRSMFAQIEADVYVMVDGDDTYGLETAPEMVRLIHEGADMVVGDRLSGAYYQENKRAFHSFGNDLVRFEVNHLFHAKIKDIMTGYRAFSYEFVKTFAIHSRGFEIETEMSVFAAYHNLRLDTIPITYRDRPAGSYSKLHTFRDGAKVLFTIGNLYRKYRPFAYYGLWSLPFLGLGVGFLIPVFIDFAKTGEVQRFPTLICCCFSLLVALLCLFAGILFSTLQTQQQEEFERAYHQAASFHRQSHQ